MSPCLLSILLSIINLNILLKNQIFSIEEKLFVNRLDDLKGRGCQIYPELCDETEFCVEDRFLGFCSKKIGSLKFIDVFTRRTRNQCLEQFNRDQMKIRYIQCLRRLNSNNVKSKTHFSSSTRLVSLVKREINQSYERNDRIAENLDGKVRFDDFNFSTEPKKLMKDVNPISTSGLNSESNKSSLSAPNQHQTDWKNESQTSGNVELGGKWHQQTLFGYVITSRNFYDQNETFAFVQLISQLGGWPINVFTSIKFGRKMLLYNLSKNSLSIYAENVTKLILDHRKIFEQQFNLEIIDVASGDVTEHGRYESGDGSRVVSIILIIFSLVLLLLIGFGLLHAIQSDENIRRQLIHRPRTNNRFVSENSSKRQLIRKGDNENPIPTTKNIPDSNDFARDSIQCSSTSSKNEEFSSVKKINSTPKNSILSYIDDQIRDRNRLEKSWIDLAAEHIELDRNSTSTALSERNVKKNRYSDSIPYDHARVQLLDTDADGDYINASPIFDSDSKCKYIATQGPMLNTAELFWQMVWEQSATVIVALTRPIENGITMCHHYWPVEDSIRYSDFEISLISEKLCTEDYLIRSFYLKNVETMEIRSIIQCHFLTWEECGSLPSANSLLDFRQTVQQACGIDPRTIIVHCNDGTGRTGTFIVIDIILNEIANGKNEINIETTLKCIRDQRPGMIKTKEQYKFVFSVVAQGTKNILSSMNSV